MAVDYNQYISGADRIAGIFRGRKLSRIGGKMEFRGENFRGLLASTAYCRPSLQTIAEKTFAERHKTAKFAKVYSLESFPLYCICKDAHTPIFITEV